jgi:CubicO group peptidase (beta-lactamase class C family)
VSAESWIDRTPARIATTFGGVGAGWTAFWVDPEPELWFALITTGLMEDSFHLERVETLSDLVIGSITR